MKGQFGMGHGIVWLEFDGEVEDLLAGILDKVGIAGFDSFLFLFF